jgi:nucleoside-diphosphate-sugar epimerase
MTTPPKDLVLVTGGSGFLAGYCILQLLNEGYLVRTTLRSHRKDDLVRSTLTHGGATNLSNLTFVQADLSSDDGWAEAVQDCSYVLHVASPFPGAPPKHENDLIVPARDGTLRVLRASRDAGVKRVVVTSSFAAIGYGQPVTDQPFTEENWTVTDNPRVGAYQKSKTLAEKAAWEFVEKEGGAMELSVVNPVGIFGPVLGKEYATSVEVVYRLMTGAMPACPQISFGIVDVRDVASLHVVAMTHPAAKGERFMAIAPPTMSIKEVSLALKEKMGNKARRAPTWLLPNFVLRIVALFDPTAGLVIPELGKDKKGTNEKAKRILGFEPKYSNVDALVATAESLIELGIVKV